jgi:hypothetical protein
MRTSVQGRNGFPETESRISRSRYERAEFRKKHGSIEQAGSLRKAIAGKRFGECEQPLSVQNPAAPMSPDKALLNG